MLYESKKKAPIRGNQSLIIGAQTLMQQQSIMFFLALANCLCKSHVGQENEKHQFQ